MAKHKRSPEKTRQEFDEQIKAMRASMKSYDEGNKWEAKRIATVLFTLLHDDQGRTKSLLGQLSIRNKVRYLDSVDEENHQALKDGTAKFHMPFSPLVVFHYNANSDDGEIGPRLSHGFYGRVTRRSPNFNTWYDGVIYMDDEGNTFSRKNLIFAVRSQDGGAHFDAAIHNDTYQMFSTQWTGRMKLGTSKGFKDPEAHLASIRQIAWEVDESINDFASLRPSTQPL